MKPEQENDDDEGDVTDEDEAADIDEEKATTLLGKSGAGAEGAASGSGSGNVTPTATPPMKSKEKKSKKVQRLVFYTRMQDSQNRGEITVQATGLDLLKQRTLHH